MPSDGQSLRPGTLLDVYEIEQVLGTGGFGVTYRARDRSLACAVAIKEYFPAHLAHRDDQCETLTPHSEEHGDNYRWGLGRFLDEARTLARFKEPGIVRVSRLFEANGTAYLVMDYVEGVSLDVHLKQQGVLTEAEALQMLRPLLEGLHAVHAQNIMHRDIKPGNIYLRDDGAPVLLDFGAAREALEGASAAMTMIVTPGYAPMEQYTQDERQGPWSDLYALGATLVHCLHGRAPTAAPDRLARQVGGRSDPLDEQLAELGSRVSPAFIGLLRDLMALSIQDRPASADHVLERMSALEPEAGDTLLMDLQRPSRQSQRLSQDSRRGHSRPVSADVRSSPDTVTVLQGPVPVSSLSLSQLQRLAERAGGSLAERAVEASMAQSRSGLEAIERIAGFIGDEQARRQFEQHARVVLKAAARGSRELTSMPPASPLSRHPSGAASRPAPSAELSGEVSPGAPTEVAPMSGTPRTDRVQSATVIDEEFASTVEHRLAEALGPIAAMLVKRARPRAGSHAELVRMLAEELDDDAERARFTRGLL